jgi:general stress protein 26
MDESIPARITRAKELLASAKHAAMATVNVDGSPHNTPFFFIYDDQLEYI